MSRIDDLLAKMTLREKLGQLNMVASGYAVTGPLLGGESPDAIRDGDIGNLLNMVGADHVDEVQRIAVEQSRLGIPLLICLDVIHGHRTAFPVPLGEASAFDPALWARTARVAAVEAWNDGVALTFAPMLDVSRDPRWGRIVEGAGESPLVASRMATAKVKGFQGSDIAAVGTLAACAKHFCAYGAVEAGREYAAVDVSERALHEVYLPPFEAAVRAGVATVMPAFTNLAGIPLTAHDALIDGWLRGKVGFDGVIISDYNAVAELLHHGVAADLAEAAALALKAGVDIDMVSNAYRHHLPEALERGLVTMADIDTSVRRVLTLKEKLGLFEKPYRRGAEPKAVLAGDADHHAIAHEAARRSCVLLKNDGNALPLAVSKRVALIGPLADARDDMRGPWAGISDPKDSVTVLEGFKAIKGLDVTYAEGVTIDGVETSEIAPALDVARAADVVVLCLGERALMSGEAASRAHPHLPGRQRALAEAVMGLGKTVVVVLFAGRPLIEPWLFEKADAVLMAWFPGEQAGPAIAELVTGTYLPSGRLPLTWPRAVGQIPIEFAAYPTGRPFNPADHYTSKYIDESNAPQFAFGHGLGYSLTQLANLAVRNPEFGRGDTLDIAVEVHNLGERQIDETVFLFTHDPVASVARPILELKDFTQISLPPKGTATVRFALKASDLSFLDARLEPVLEPGAFEIHVGLSADPATMLTAKATLK